MGGFSSHGSYQSNSPQSNPICWANRNQNRLPGSCAANLTVRFLASSRSPFAMAVLICCAKAGFEGLREAQVEQKSAESSLRQGSISWAVSSMPAVLADKSEDSQADKRKPENVGKRSGASSFPPASSSDSAKAKSNFSPSEERSRECSSVVGRDGQSVGVCMQAPDSLTTITR